MDSVVVAPAQKDDALLHVQKPGGWEPIKNTNDPYVQEIGRFAVMEQPMPSGLVASMEFICVVSGETQMGAEIKYRLVLKVKVVEKILVHGCPVSFNKLCMTTVVVKPKSWEVISFEALKPCPGPVVQA